MFLCLDIACFQKASQAPFVLWCLPWFHCTKQDFQDYQDPSVLTQLYRMAIGRGKKLKVYRYPLTFPKWWPSLALPEFHSTHIPIIIACSILCLVLPHTLLYMHHNPSICDLSFCSCKPGYMLFLKLFDTVLMKSTKFHSPLQTLTHNLTPPSLHVKLPLKTLKNPSFPLYPNSIPIYPILYTSFINISFWDWMLAAPKPISTPVGSRHFLNFYTFFQIPNIYSLFQFMLTSFFHLYFLSYLLYYSQLYV